MIGGFLMSQLASLAAGYVVTKVTGVLGQHWWGRIVVAAAERRLRRREQAEFEAALDGTPRLTPEQRAKLSTEEQSAIDHGNDHRSKGK